MRKSWPEERQEIAMWLSGYLSMYKKWVDRILDNDDHDVTKNKIIDLLTEWIAKLEEEKLKIMRMSDTTPEVKESEKEISAFASDFELVKVNDHKSIMLINCTDMEAMQAFMTTPEMQQWDEENGCVDVVYSMERIN